MEGAEVAAAATAATKRVRGNSLVGRVGITIKTLRFARCISQAALAKKVGVNPYVISKLERGRQEIGLNYTVKIAQALGLTVEGLLRKASTVDPKLVEKLEAFARG